MKENTKQILKPSLTQEWETPPEIFDPLDLEFRFDLDPCCRTETAKCKDFFTKAEDGLKQSWNDKRVFMNPPYGREIAQWVCKAYREVTKVIDPAILVVGLIPSRTDTRYFHEWIYHKAELRFVRGRISFIGRDGTRGTSAVFPSMVVIWRSQFG